MKIGSYAKAIMSALAAGSGSLATAAADGLITPGEWYIALGAILAGLGLTAAVPNAKQSDNQ